MVRLALELKAVGRPAIMALNMIDISQRQGIEIDAERLARELCMPVVATVATRRRGIEGLVTQIEATATGHRRQPQTFGASPRRRKFAICTENPREF